MTVATTTASVIIRDALSILGVLALGEPADADVLADGLDFLNSMVDSWSTDSMNILTVQEQVLSCAPGTAYVTIGPGGMINIDRPYQVEAGAFFRVSTIDYRMRQINRPDFEAIPNKSVQATYPVVYYYDANLPMARVYFWQVLSGTAELHLPIVTMLQQFAGLTTAYTLPPGYKRALVYSLAEEMAPTYRPLSADVMRIAQRARANIRRVNVRIPTLELPSITNRADRLNILSNTRP